MHTRCVCARAVFCSSKDGPCHFTWISHVTCCSFFIPGPNGQRWRKDFQRKQRPAERAAKVSRLRGATLKMSPKRKLNVVFTKPIQLLRPKQAMGYVGAKHPRDCMMGWPPVYFNNERVLLITNLICGSLVSLQAHEVVHRPCSGISSHYTKAGRWSKQTYFTDSG